MLNYIWDKLAAHIEIFTRDTSKEITTRDSDNMERNLQEIVQAYLNNQLPPEETDAFEQRLANDPDFAARAAEEASLQAALQTEGDQELEAKLLTYAKELNQMDVTLSTSAPAPGNTRKLTAYSRLVYAAAVLVGIIVILLPLWLMKHQGITTPVESPEEIYATNFSIPPVPEARSADGQAPWRQPYAQGDYKTTVQQLEALLADPTFTSRSEAFYYLGIAQLALGNSDAALQALAQVREESFDWEAAQWYSALALLERQRLQEAKHLFQQISKQTTHPQQKQAAEILKRL